MKDYPNLNPKWLKYTFAVLLFLVMITAFYVCSYDMSINQQKQAEARDKRLKKNNFISSTDLLEDQLILGSKIELLSYSLHEDPRGEWDKKSRYHHTLKVNLHIDRKIYGRGYTNIYYILLDYDGKLVDSGVFKVLDTGTSMNSVEVNTGEGTSDYIFEKSYLKLRWLE